jgi:mono/diheme cytochrome c family protein
MLLHNRVEVRGWKVMRQKFFLLLTFSVLAYVFIAAGSAMAQGSVEERSATLLGTLYGQNFSTEQRAAYDKAGCWTCHNYQGTGGRAGPAIARPTMPYVVFSRFVRTSSQRMPPYTERVLSEADLEAIYAYLQSIPEPPQPETLPLLQP